MRLLRKYSAILLIVLLSCSPEKEIQVEAHLWVLVEKKPAMRLEKDKYQSYVWLTWLSSEGVTYYEKVKEEEADKYPIGIILKNRDRR